MKYRRLGKTDIDVSEVCMGCWQISTDRSDYWGTQVVKDSLDAVRASLDVGINFFDTAEDYDDGGSEEVLGRGLGERRSQAIVATKVNPGHLHPREIGRACEGSLRRLQTDYIDLYQIHFPNPDVPLEDTLAEMEKLRDAGKVRTIGVSNFGASYLRDLPDTAVVSDQVPYSLLWRAIEFEILPVSIERGMSVLAYSPLFQGLLTGKYERVEDVPPGRMQTRIFSSRRPNADHSEPGCEREAFQAIDGIRRVCESLGRSMADVALAWVLAQQGVTSVIAGSRNREQVQQNAAAADLKLPNDVLRELGRITEPVKRAIGRNADMWMHESRLERPGRPPTTRAA